MKRIITLAFLLVQLAVYSQEKYTILSVPKELKENANSVVLDELIEIDITNENKMNYRIRRVIAVLNKMGDKAIDAYARYDDNSRVKKIEAYVYDALGNEVNHYRQKDFKDVSAVSGFSLYQDDRYMYLDYTPTAYPYIMEFTSEIESNTTAFLPYWMPVDRYVSSTKKSVYKIDFSTTNKPRYKSENLEGYNISVQETPQSIICTAENIKAIKHEEHSPPFRDINPKVLFALNNFYLKGTPGYGKDWQEFGSWMQKSLLDGTGELSPATVNKMKELVKGETTNEGKARKIYQHLQDKVRYISVQIGIGGWKPMLAAEVDQLSYGDCKALTNYTKALLESVGVPSYYTILYSSYDERDITNDFSSMQGNHAILGVPEGDEIIWLECTSQDAPFGFVSNGNDDRDVLIVTEEGGKIVHTKKYTSEENLQETTATIILSTTGGIAAEILRTSQGLQYDQKYRLEKETEGDLKEKYMNLWGHINGFSIENLSLDNNRNDIVLTEKMEIKAPVYSTVVNNDFLFCVNVFNQSNYIPPRITDRRQKLNIAMGYKDVDRLEIQLPNGFETDVLPDNKLVENEFGSYKVSYKKLSENKIEYTRELIIRKGMYPPEAYKKYRSFRRTISKLDKTKILLTQKLQ